MLDAAARSRPQEILFTQRGRLLQIIKEKSLLTGRFKLASGLMSDYYLDMKPTTFSPEGAALTAEIVLDEILKHGRVDAIGGLELGAVPVISAVCARSWPDHPIDGFIVRKEKKGHGTDKKIDGNFKPNSNVILLDDVTTKGGSVMQAAEAVRTQGAKVVKIITIVDRLEGAAERLQKEGIELIPIFTTRDLLGK
jgi:orotate phosphoribosyltransferase